MQERRAQGVCYNCDEKYVFGHKCQPKKFLLLLCDDEPENADSTLLITELSSTKELASHETKLIQLSIISKCFKWIYLQRKVYFF